MKELLRPIKQWLYHRLKLYPIYRVIAAINRHFSLKNCVALEAFAYTGAWQAQAYAKYPSYLEAWEIDPDCELALKKNLPGATVRITNSFEEIKRCDKKFSFINVDTHQGQFGAYCENFEFYPLLFRVAANDCIVNLNVMPEASAWWRKKYPDLFTPQHLEKRKAFYGVSDPEHVSLDQMLATYGRIAAQNGFKIVWHYYKKRSLTYYLALHLSRS